MNIRHLESFVWLCRLRNFRKAALRLHITQPAMSSRIRTLEKELGCVLFERASNRVTPTPEGRRFLPYAERITRLFAEAKSDLASSSPIRGRVRIGIIDTVTETWLPDLVEGLRRDHPDLLLDIVVDSTANLLAQLRDDAINIAFTLALPFDPTLWQVTICAFAMEWFGGPETPPTDKPFAKADLERMPIITFPFGTPPNAILEHYFERQEGWLAHKSTANSLTTMVRLVSDGLGIAAMPPATLLPAIEEGRLVRLETEEPLDPIELVAVAAAGQASPVNDAVISMARQVAHELCVSLPDGLGWMPER
ncbi:MAG: LysR family transcriptional regulator [Pseudomonadota bacterium]